MRALKIKITLLLLLAGTAVLSQSNIQFITTDKEFCRSGDTLHYTITRSSIFCNTPVTLYAELINSSSQVVVQQVLLVNDVETKCSFLIRDIDTGYYLLRVYSGNDAKYKPASIPQLAIGVNIPGSEQFSNRGAGLFLFPEGGRALFNFTHRFAVFLSSNGNGFNKIHFRNKAGQLIAICTTNSSGWSAVDLPLLRNEVYTAYDSKGIVLTAMNVLQSPLVNDIGFSIHAMQNGQHLYIEMRKGEGEQRKSVTLQAFYKNIFLYEAKGNFIADTTIVATSFSITDFENKLLQLVLKDENGDIVVRRLVLIPAVNTVADISKVRSELFCTAVKAPLGFFENYLSQTVNDRLIALNTDSNEMLNTASGLFSLFFTGNVLAGKLVSYSIINREGKVLMIGSSTGDSTGLLEISGCSFRGQASVNLYINGQRVTNGIKPQASLVPGKYSALVFEEVKKEINKRILAGKKISIVPKAAENEPVYQEESIELPEATVIAMSKKRVDELENKYVNNGMFRDINSISINVEDDETAIYYSLADYLVKKIPGLLIRRNPQTGQEAMNYRMGFVDFFLDESRFTIDGGIPNLSMRDVGFIRFFRNPVFGSSLDVRGGQLLVGGSFVGGLQGSIAVYTRKYVGEKQAGDPKPGFVVWGFAVQE